MFSGAQIFIFAFLIFPFSHTSRLLVLRHHRQILFTDFYLKPRATTSATTVGTAIPANSSGRQGHILNVRPSFQTSLFSPHHHMRVISKSKTCGFVAEASAVKLMVLPTRPSNVYQIPHTHPPVFSKMAGASPNPPLLLLPALVRHNRCVLKGSPGTLSSLLFNSNTECVCCSILRSANPRPGSLWQPHLHRDCRSLGSPLMAHYRGNSML